MSQPPRGSDRDLTNRRIPVLDDGEAADPAGEGQIESRLPFGSGAEGLCHTIPELGAMPYVQEREKGRRVVRLVSVNAESDLSIELQPGVNKIGRQRTGNHIVLVSGEVSRFHAELQVNEDSVVVRDLGSANGTFVNQQRVEGEQVLEPGALLGFSSQFLFQLQIDMAMAAPEVQTLEKDDREPLHAAAAPSPPEKVPESLEERRRRLEEAPRLASKTAPGKPSPSRPVMTAPWPALREEPAAAPVAAPRSSITGPPPAASAPPRPAPTVAAADVAVGSAAISPEDSLLGQIAPPPPGAEVAILERERRQLAVLYQVSKRCMAAESLAELDRLLINVLERIVAFERGFITYQLPSGDWKLVMSPKGDRWDRSVVRGLLQTALRGKAAIVVRNSAADGQLGSPGSSRSDARLLLSLRTRSAPVGAIFLISSRSDSFDDQTVDFLSLFSDIAALALAGCSRFEGRSA